MTRVEPPSTAALPDDPVRAALDNPDLRSELERHAVAGLNVRLANQPLAIRRQPVNEVLQECFLRAYTHRAKFDPTHGTVAAWIHGILNRILQETCRTLRKLPAQPSSDPSTWESLAERIASDAESESCDLLALLAAEQRQIIIWHHRDELSHREIGERLGIPEATARVRLCRAMTMLKEKAARKEAHQ